MRIRIVFEQVERIGPAGERLEPGLMLVAVNGEDGEPIPDADLKWLADGDYEALDLEIVP